MWTYQNVSRTNQIGLCVQRGMGPDNFSGGTNCEFVNFWIPQKINKRPISGHLPSDDSTVMHCLVLKCHLIIINQVLHDYYGKIFYNVLSTIHTFYTQYWAGDSWVES